MPILEVTDFQAAASGAGGALRGYRRAMGEYQAMAQVQEAHELKMAAARLAYDERVKMAQKKAKREEAQERVDAYRADLAVGKRQPQIMRQAFQDYGPMMGAAAGLGLTEAKRAALQATLAEMDDDASRDEFLALFEEETKQGAINYAQANAISEIGQAVDDGLITPEKAAEMKADLANAEHETSPEYVFALFRAQRAKIAEKHSRQMVYESVEAELGPMLGQDTPPKGSGLTQGEWNKNRAAAMREVADWRAMRHTISLEKQYEVKQEIEDLLFQRGPRMDFESIMATAQQDPAWATLDQAGRRQLLNEYRDLEAVFHGAGAQPLPKPGAATSYATMDEAGRDALAQRLLAGESMVDIIDSGLEIDEEDMVDIRRRLDAARGAGGPQPRTDGPPIPVEGTAPQGAPPPGQAAIQPQPPGGEELVGPYTVDDPRQTSPEAMAAANVPLPVAQGPGKASEPGKYVRKQAWEAWYFEVTNLPGSKLPRGADLADALFREQRISPALRARLSKLFATLEGIRTMPGPLSQPE